MLVGTLAAPAIIRRAGHIRAFAALRRARHRLGRSSCRCSCRRRPGSCSARSSASSSPGSTPSSKPGSTRRRPTPIAARSTRSTRSSISSHPRPASCCCSRLGLGGFRPFAVAGGLLALAIVPMAMTSVDPPAQPRSVRPRLLWLIRAAPLVVFCGFGRRRGKRRALRARTDLRRRHRHDARSTRRSSPRRSCSVRRSASFRSARSRIASTGGWSWPP